MNYRSFELSDSRKVWMTAIATASGYARGTRARGYDTCHQWARPMHGRHGQQDRDSEVAWPSCQCNQCSPPHHPLDLQHIAQKLCSNSAPAAWSYAMLAAHNFTAAARLCASIARHSSGCIVRPVVSSVHADHICHPENDRRRCQVMTAERLLNTSELCEAAANLEAVTGITPGMLEALHRHTLEAWRIDQDTSEYWHEAWYQRWREADLQRHQAVQRQAVLDWARVRRGSDLFVRGLGRFNIDVAVCESLAAIFHSNHFYSSYFPSEQRLARIARREEAERSLRYQRTWVLRPRDLQARGHFAALDRLSNLDQHLWIDSALQPATNLARLGWILALPDDHPIRCHLIRFHSYWACPDNANTLHELVEAAESLLVANVRQVGPRRATLLGEAGVSSMIDLAHLDDDRQARVVDNCTADYRALPKRVLQTLVQNAAAELPRRWSVELTAGTKPLTLLRRLRELQQARLVGPDVYFAHLDSLADGPINAYGEQMQVLRSKHAIVQTAARLSNCAASYATFVENKQYVLVCLVDTTTGAPKALGGAYVVRDLWKEETATLRNVEGDPASLLWDQVVKHKNREPSLATRNAFDVYLVFAGVSPTPGMLSMRI